MTYVQELVYISNIYEIRLNTERKNNIIVT